MPNVRRNVKSSKYAYKPDVGVKTDFETILQRFAQAGTVRYDAFAKLWKEMKMHLYCAGRQNQREAREFMEDCFRIAIQFCVPPSSFLVRAGAIYLLYGLYHFQLVSPKVKIRITPQHWQTMLAFQDEAREQQHLDLDYIFQSMVVDRAFSFVAEVAWFYPTPKETEDVSVISESLKESCNAVEEIFSSSGLNQLSLIHDQYHKMKVVLNGAESTKPDTSLDIIHQDLIQGVYKTLRVHRDRQASIIQGVPYAKNKSAPQEEELNIGEDYKVSIQKGLKKKAFKTFKGYKVRGSDSNQTATGPKKRRREKQANWSQIKYSRQIRGRSAHINLFEKDEIDDTVPAEEPSCMKIALAIPEQDLVVYKSADSSGTEEEEEKSKKGKAPVKGKAKKKSSKKKKSKEEITDSNSEDEDASLQQLDDAEESVVNKSSNRPNRIEIDLISDSDISEAISPAKKRRSSKMKEVVSEPDVDDVDEDSDEVEQMEHHMRNKRTKIKQEVPMEYGLACPEKKPKQSKKSEGKSNKRKKSLKNKLSADEFSESESGNEIDIPEGPVEPTAQQKLHQKLAERAKQSRLSKGKKK